MDRETAWQTVEEFVADAGLRRHVRSVEASMRLYAGRLDADPERWGLAGLLHDFDWEIHPDVHRHPKEGVPILEQRGLDDPEVIHAILAHNPAGTGVEAERPIDYALRACDDVTGLILAAALVRPHKDLRQLKVKSIKRNWKEKAFAAGVDRDEVSRSTEDFSRACFDGELELWEHVGNVLTAMQGIAADLELDGRLAAPGG